MVDKQNSSVPKESEFDDFFYEGRFELRHYWYVIVKYKWGILGLVVSVGLLVTVLAFSMQPIYRSTATLLIGDSQSLLETGSDLDLKSAAAQDQFFSTQTELLKSREINKAALARLELDQKPGLNPLLPTEQSRFDWRQWLPRSWLEAIGVEFLPVPESDPDRALLLWLSNNLDIAPVRNTSMVKVSFESPNSNLAAMVANEVANAYIESYLNQRVETTAQASDWLKEQLERSQNDVVSSIDALQRYREDAGLLDLEGMQSVFTEQLKILASEISAAQRIRTEAENLYRRAQRMQATGQLDSLPVVFNNAWLQRLKEQEEGLERQIKLDSERFQGDYPGLDEDQQNLTALQEQINQTLIQIVEGMKTDYEVALANERQAEAKLIEIEEKVQNANRKEFQADALEQVVLSNRQSYDAFLSKLMETTTLGRDTISMIARVVDPAVSEIIPYKPKKLRMISVAVVLSLFAGVGFAFLLDRLDNTLKSREDVEDRLGLPVLGELIALTKKSSKQGDCNPATEYRDSPKSGYSESIRTVRTAVALSALDKSQNPVLMITSTLSGEGKSTIALNLAFAMSQLGNVLLLDGDLRRPKSAKLCGLDNKIKGLTDLIAGTAKVAECIHKVSGEIHLLPAGTTLPPDPLPMLSSERFSVLLQKLSTAYDTVIIDSAPVELVSDARLLATQATGLIYVVKADETPLQAVKQGLKSLKQTGIPILGAILNQIDPDKAQSYGKYKYGYNRYENYGYGEEVSKQA